jgi:sulfide:quinone oxidoreductase
MCAPRLACVSLAKEDFMKNIVVLGAGTGGALISNMLTHHLDLTEWKITVIDKSRLHVYQPGLLFIPFRLYGYDSVQALTKDITDPLPRNVEFVAATIKLIDHEKKRVETDQGDYAYDFLVCSMGCSMAPEDVEGLDEALGEKVFTFYTGGNAQKLADALDTMAEGRLVIDICNMPIKCPVAPVEFAFLADYYFHLKGIRDRVDITLVTPYTGAFTKPNANRVLTEIAHKKGINIVPNFTAASVDTEAKRLTAFEGATVDYDLLVTIPANVGPAVIDDSGLGDGNGFGLTDPRTLKSKKTDYLYFMGDNTNVATSKAGSVAHFEAETVLENLLREMEGKPPLQSYDGHSNCFIESGYHKALLIDFNYDMEPLEGSFPTPYMGPFSLLKESYLNHLGKMTFEWVYWNMLLPGRLGHVPMLPSHMNFLGKDLKTAPQLRHAQELHVRDVMSKSVISIKRGASLTEAVNIMTKERVSGLPVLDEAGKLIGIVTEGDFISAMDINGGAVAGALETVVRKHRARKKMGTIVDDIMTREPITIKQDDTLQKAVEMMDRSRIKRLIVTDDDNRVNGVVSRRDVIKLFAMK